MNKKKLIFVSGIANTFEWYDYALFGSFASVIGEKFFPGHDKNVQLLKAFLVFALGYLMRPIGGIFFGVIGDKFGRKIALSSAIICMAIPTALIGVIPTYTDIGIISTYIMIIIRMLQGLSMGGALTGSISFIIEHSDNDERGFLGSIPMCSICIGVLLGSISASSSKYFLSEESFNSWGWRLPFLIGVFIFFIGIYIKHHTSETPQFSANESESKISSSPIKESLYGYTRQIIISIFVNAPGSVLFYLEAIFFSSYLKNTRGFDSNKVDILVMSCYVIMAFVTLLSGYISDKVGRVRIFVVNNISIILLMPILLYFFKYGEFFMVVISQVVIALMAAFYIGSEPALQAELYPSRVRNTALSISYNTAVSLFGGTTPYFISCLVMYYGSIINAIYYIYFVVVLALIALYFYKKDPELK
ncbi:MAG TPA: MFS transporter [Candidatus Megaira endosymbiont of Hartmannula sinica]|nr:MFS transporter [Candidatus Megaera endosymbiont of Hartmannula sinica]